MAESNSDAKGEDGKLAPLKEPAEAWKTLLQLALSIVPVILVLMGGAPDVGQGAERCFVTAQRLLQESLDCRALHGRHASDWPRDATGHIEIVARLDEACDGVCAKAYPPIRTGGDEVLLLAVGRIYAGVDRWRNVMDDLHAIRTATGFFLLGLFVLGGAWLLRTIARPGDVFDALTTIAPRAVRRAFNVAFSFPFLFLLGVLAMVLFVEYVELKHTSDGVKGDLEHRYLLEGFVPEHAEPGSSDAGSAAGVGAGGGAQGVGGPEPSGRGSGPGV